MSRSRNVDRDAILARRALFVSTALAGLACTSTGSGKPQADPREQLVEADTASSAAEGSLESTEPAATQRPWSELMADAPPLDIAEQLPERERQHLESLARVVAFEYDKLRQAWEGAPDCSASDESCTGWAELVTLLEPFYAESFVGECSPRANGMTASVKARQAAHTRFQRQLLAEIQAHLAAVAGRFGDDSAKGWAALFSRATGPKPMPCLSACAEPMQVDLLAQVRFAPGSAALTLDDPSKNTKLMLDSVLGPLQGYFPGKLMVRGHADPSEAEPEALSLARAQAVVAWLVEAGADADKLEAVGFGTRLPVEAPSRGPEHNPRVDFELI